MHTEQMFQRYGPAYRWYATATVMLGTMAVILAATIINVAVPTIMLEFDLIQAQVHWLATGFLAAMTVGMLHNAWCVARFGSRGAFVLAMIIFIIASVVGGLSEHFTVLVAARVVQGLAAGLVQPQAMVTIFAVFPSSKRGQAMGIYGLGVVLGPAMAPALGGVLVDAVSWRAVFFIVLPACFVAMAMAWRFLPGRAPGRTPPLDWPGLGLLSAGLVALLWALASGHRLGWSNPVLLTALIGGPLLLALFGFWQRSRAYPLFDVRVFNVPGFGAGFALSVVIGAGVFASTYVTPLYFQQVQHLSASQAGLMLMPAGLAMAFTFPVAGYLTDRMSLPRLISAGLVLFMLSMALMRGASLSTVAGWLVLWTVLGRIGLGLVMPPVTMGSLALLPDKLLPQGSGIINFGRQIGGAVGVNLSAVTVQLFSDKYAAQHPEATQARAFEAGFDDAFLLLLIIHLLAFAAVYMFWRGQRRVFSHQGATGENTT